MADKPLLGHIPLVNGQLDPNEIVAGARKAISRAFPQLTTRSWSFSERSLAVAVYDGDGYLGTVDLDADTGAARIVKPWGTKSDRAIGKAVLEELAGVASVA